MCFNIFIGEARTELKRNPAKAFKFATIAKKHAAEGRVILLLLGHISIKESFKLVTMMVKLKHCPSVH